MARITVGRASIAYSEAGRGSPTVLLHGSASPAARWRGLVRELVGRFRLFVPDLHGHGESERWSGPGPLTLAAEGRIVAALADRAEEPVHLVGHGYGAAVALHFAQAHPNRVRSLVLIEPASFHLLREAGPAHAALLAEIENLAATLARTADEAGAGMADFVEFWNDGGAWSHTSAERRDAMERRTSAVTAHFIAMLGEATPPAAYESVRVPMLIVCGTESPAPLWLIAEVLIAAPPQAHLLRVHGVGHILPRTRAEAVDPARVARIDAPRQALAAPAGSRPESCSMTV